MQKLWKVVLEGEGCDPKTLAAMGFRYAKGTKVGTLDEVSVKLTKQGFTKTPLSRERVKQIVFEGLCRSVAYVTDRSRVDDERHVARVRKAVRKMTRMKAHYSCSTNGDPHLNERLTWWRLRKVGRKPNSSSYDREDRSNQ